MEVFRNLYYYSHRIAHSFEMAFWRPNGCVAMHDYHIVFWYASYTTILLNRHIDIIYRHTYTTSDLLAVPGHTNTFNIALTRLKIVLSAWCVTNINVIQTPIPAIPTTYHSTTDVQMYNVHILVQKSTSSYNITYYRYIFSVYNT